MTLAPDEVEILASPRPGTAVAHDEGLVVVIDTELTPDAPRRGRRARARSARSRTSARRPGCAARRPDRGVGRRACAGGPVDLAAVAARDPRRCGRRRELRRMATSAPRRARRRPVTSPCADARAAARLGWRASHGEATIWTERRADCGPDDGGRRGRPDDAGDRPPRWALFVGLAATVVVARPAREGMDRRRRDPAGGRSRSSATSSGSSITHNTGALFGLFRDQAPLFALVSIGVIGLIVGYHGRAGAELRCCRSRSGCCSAARSATSPTGCGSGSRRLRRRRDRRSPLVHLQRRRRRDQRRAPAAPRCSPFRPALVDEPRRGPTSDPRRGPMAEASAPAARRPHRLTVPDGRGGPARRPVRRRRHRPVAELRPEADHAGRLTADGAAAAAPTRRRPRAPRSGSTCPPPEAARARARARDRVLASSTRTTTC